MTLAQIFSRRGGWSESVSATYRSGLEEKIAAQLENAGVHTPYEGYQIQYTIPASNHTYTPDFPLPNGIIVESKGIFNTADRQKHLYIKKQYPHLDIRFVFDNPNGKIYKGSKTTYADWCKKHGYQYAKKLIPVEWLKEKKRATTGLIAKKGAKKK